MKKSKVKELCKNCFMKFKKNDICSFCPFKDKTEKERMKDKNCSKCKHFKLPKCELGYYLKHFRLNNIVCNNYSEVEE